MTAEIEIKARVQDFGVLLDKLGEKAEYGYAYKKEDTYWVSGKSEEGALQKLRLRREERTFPGKKPESVTLVTCKKKTVSDGVEINDELEFEVKRIRAFEKFLGQMGMKPESVKKKRGWAFSREGINAELSDVEGLGWFIELEILAGDTREETVIDAKKRLRAFLACLGIEESAVESRFYTEMLRESIEPVSKF